MPARKPEECDLPLIEAVLLWRRRLGTDWHDVGRDGY